MALSKSSKNGITTVLGVLVMAVIAQFIVRDEPIYHVIPNLMLFTPFHRSCPQYWRDPFDYLPKKREHEQIPEIAAVDYSYDNLREVSKGFRVPVVVRGLFSDTVGVKNWHKKGYLAKILGDHEIPIMRKGNPYEQMDRYTATFREGITEILKNIKSSATLFFPVLSRFELNTTVVDNGKRLKSDVEDLIRRDLRVHELIWDGFSTKEKHPGFHAAQMVVGRGSSPGTNYTGLAWHAEPGTNWYAQVHGSKRWHFMAPKDSALLLPTRDSMNSIATSDMYRMEELHHRLPIRYVDLKAGDLLYNPDWQWHHTKNYPGLCIGVPMRELNPFYMVRNNPLYMLVTGRNHILGGA